MTATLEQQGSGCTSDGIFRILFLQILMTLLKMICWCFERCFSVAGNENCRYDALTAVCVHSWKCEQVSFFFGVEWNWWACCVCAVYVRMVLNRGIPKMRHQKRVAFLVAHTVSHFVVYRFQSSILNVVDNRFRPVKKTVLPEGRIFWLALRCSLLF